MNTRKFLTKKETSSSKIGLARHLVATCLLLGGLPPGALADSRDPCRSASPLLLNGVEHIYRSSPEETDFFRLDVPQAGVLTLEVSVEPRQVGPRQAGARAAAGVATGPMLGWLGDDCSIHRAVLHRTVLHRTVLHRTVLHRAVLHRTVPVTGPQRPPAWDVMTIETPGTYFFVVVSGSRRDLWPGFYTLRTGFAATEPMPVVEPCRGVGLPDKEIDPWESDPISLLAPPCRVDPRVLDRLCALAAGDDHGDLLACARRIPLATEVLAELRPEDLDAFSFVLESRREVVLETAGEMDTHGELVDALGHHLAADDDSGAGTNFRIVAMLEPGRYFLRVETVAALEGPYVLGIFP